MSKHLGNVKGGTYNFWINSSKNTMDSGSVSLFRADKSMAIGTAMNTVSCFCGSPSLGVALCLVCLILECVWLCVSVVFMTNNAKHQMVRSNSYDHLPRMTLAIRQTAVSLKQVRLVLFGHNKTLFANVSTGRCVLCHGTSSFSSLRGGCAFAYDVAFAWVHNFVWCFFLDV